MTGTTPTTSGYVDVDGVRIYHEVHGTGSPLVLLHGGVLAIDLDFHALLPALAESHQVIGIELQGHGRTNDTDRPMSVETFAADVVAVLDHLGVDSADVLGHSLGGAIAIELAISHASRVRSIVPISASVDTTGTHEDLTDPALMATSTRMPTADDFAAMRRTYDELSPHPEHFDDFLMKMQGLGSTLVGWSDEQLATITAPTLVVQGDRDFTTNAHAAQMVEKIPGSRLAILPDTTHMTVTLRADYLLPMLADFLS
ncbi:alpha/beta fold hydrolase [Solicola sp. PLA-1-18]|uniref:alpha/beta fold hydrolase n=1 Tax=Solicola sp. PLA-1-18 TaxID=3380532 RepID=UPI003B7FC588